MTKLTDARPTMLRGGDPTWRAAQRDAAFSRYAEVGLPDVDDDVWRYAPLAKLALDEIELAEGAVASVRAPLPDGVRLASLEEPWVRDALGSLVGADDAFAALNLALGEGPLLLDVEAGKKVGTSVHVDVDAHGGAGFPRLLVRVQDGAEARVVEHVRGTAQLLCPVAELLVADGAQLEVTSVQDLDDASWSLARTRARLGARSTLTQVVVGLGASYSRVRADSLLDGEAASSTLHTAHVGTGSQVHDLRTMQVHRGRRTVSRLSSRAAVTDDAESVYSGLISMRRGAAKADARQVNRSLVLSQGARADAVPNLDIEENDVRCAHASSVGPIDEEQRWYLESRGVSPHDAVRLIVGGFFSEVEATLDDEDRGVLRRAIEELEVRVGAPA